ncbi:hypothetical protein [Clostridium sp.]|uniref:hypothetical protein n=1 Tax=Clostridium sp. TaxID=1506 RepID=UPI0026DC5A22|nr:hypothetical protein [Clostridium sp.]MDO5039338.1 hypothetical protein [Clostridium sp.]
MNKELKVKKIDELIKELSEYKSALLEDIPYENSKALDKLIIDKDKNISELFNWSSEKIRIEYAEFSEEKKEVILMSLNTSFLAKEIVNGYVVSDMEGNVIVASTKIFSNFIAEIRKKFFIEEKYIIELCKLNENRQLIVNFMKDYNYNSMSEYPGDLRFDFDFNYVSFKYDNDEIEVIDPTSEIYNKFSKLYPKAVLSSIRPLGF